MGGTQERHIPDTISTEAQEYLKSLEDPASLPESPAADDLEGWKRVISNTGGVNFSGMRDP